MEKHEGVLESTGEGLTALLGYSFYNERPMNSILEVLYR